MPPSQENFSTTAEISHDFFSQLNLFVALFRSCRPLLNCVAQISTAQISDDLFLVIYHKFYHFDRPPFEVPLGATRRHRAPSVRHCLVRSFYVVYSMCTFTCTVLSFCCLQLFIRVIYRSL